LLEWVFNIAMNHRSNCGVSELKIILAIQKRLDDRGVLTRFGTDSKMPPRVYSAVPLFVAAQFLKVVRGPARPAFLSAP
jgi:hypothetical protein